MDYPPKIKEQIHTAAMTPTKSAIKAATNVNLIFLFPQSQNIQQEYKK